MFSNAKVGQRAWSYNYGWGEIIENNYLHRYKLLVKFDSGYKCSYQLNGQLSDGAINQDLFYDEIKVEIPESAKKPKVEWKFPCYGKTNGELIVYFYKNKEGTIIKNGDIGSKHYNWQMSCFTPCTLEAKEM